MTMDSAVILAGGKGRRLGYDKKEILFRGKPLIETSIERLRGCFGEIIVSTNSDWTREGVRVVRDGAGAGPLAGIYRALLECKSDYLYVSACDMPFFSRSYVERLKARLAGGGYEAAAAVREDGFVEPFHAFYHKSALLRIEEQLKRGEYRPAALFKRLTFYAERAFDPRLFFNINYQDDLARAEREAGTPEETEEGCYG
jgi:molybdopterin-guanine dinucleotide biosynthesis protein A